ncbi:protein yippee-like 2 isoform X1 [Hirundo rustica]|uniref:protein yippee-like 2 isoform X1 n=1 Tax=Hirundo rustica TaxID=43150 RepID=UPI001A93EFE8|nr:protein yippee-like 2 isoform X1 [Hirundo rustica]XP_039938252.1 protein yippee-like 2 isoform X1 [Hirundo rustica]XP_039938254.1 protein yippee-like 2 isoform X1 [Hirundo rustica]XP_039938255.1 protein yippee-like 2 isoform X1 [Hirundo rustica]XP_039938256.1 protein yippee-like 2 isoform X1 [Hirundo rustica]XP_039938257.1 protein yippee-like 2 isoform X1 [Hirundo rustica]
MVKMTRSKTFQAYLPSCHRTYSCIHCRAHLANHDELISKWPPLDTLEHWFELGGRAARPQGCCCPWERSNIQRAPAQLMALGLLFIKDRPLCSRHRKSYFCTNKICAPIAAVIGRLSLCGVYRGVFTGKDWMVRKFHLLCFCSGGTRAAAGLCVSSRGVPAPLQQGQAVPSCLAQPGVAWHLPSGQGITISVPALPPEPPGWCRACLGAASQQQDTRSWSAAEGLKEASLINAINTNMLEPCVLFNSSPRKFLGALLLSESEISQCLGHPLDPLWLWVATNTGLQLPLKNRYPSRTQEFCARQGFCSWQRPGCRADLTGGWHCWLWLPASAPRGVFAL